MAVWPVTLPVLSVVNDYVEEFAEGQLRTEMDEGPAKVRKLTNAEPDILKFSQLLTKTQVGDLETFYKTTLKNGADSFTEDHPRTGVSSTLRFATPPSAKFNGGIFEAKIELEVLP